jgi:hypothetical protein
MAQPPSNEGSSPGRPVRRLPWLGVFGAAADFSSTRVSSRGPISSVRTGHGWLASRGIEVPDALREQITTCTDLDQLDIWIRRAATARTAHDLLTDDRL